MYMYIYAHTNYKSPSKGNNNSNSHSNSNSNSNDNNNNNNESNRSPSKGPAAREALRGRGRALPPGICNDLVITRDMFSLIILYYLVKDSGCSF